MREQAARVAAASDSKPKGAAPVKTAATDPTKPAKSRKLSYKEQRELDELPARIEALEAEQKVLGALLADGSVYTKEPDRAAQAQARYGRIDDELLLAMERWEALGAKA